MFPVWWFPGESPRFKWGQNACVVYKYIYITGCRLFFRYPPGGGLLKGMRLVDRSTRSGGGGLMARPAALLIATAYSTTNTRAIHVAAQHLHLERRSNAVISWRLLLACLRSRTRSGRPFHCSGSPSPVVGSGQVACSAWLPCRRFPPSWPSLP